MSANLSFPKKIILRVTSSQFGTQNIGGTDYRVYPVVMLTEGVHHGIGSNPVYYSPQVLQASANDWNNIPVTVHHPIVNGNHVLVNFNGEIIKDWGVGFIRNSRWEDGKLKAEIYVDPLRAERLSPGALSYIDNGGSLDVSTGLLASEDGVAGSWNSEQYVSSITGIFPDHLALLPGERGACSWSDGCGVRFNSSGKIEEKVNTSVFVFNEVELGQRLEKIRMFVDAMDQYNQTQERYLQIHFIKAVYSDYFIYKKVDRTNRQQETEVYFRQSYMMDENGNVITSGDPTEVMEETRYLPVTNGSETNANNSTQGGVKMANGKCCTKKVDALIAHQNSAWTADDREFLEGLNEAQIDKMAATLNVSEEEVNAAGASPARRMLPRDQMPDACFQANADGGTVEVTLESYLQAAPGPIRSLINSGLRELDNKRAGLIAKILAAPGNKFTEQQLKDFDVAVLDNVAGLLPVPAAPAPAYSFAATNPATITNAADEEEPYMPTTLSIATQK